MHKNYKECKSLVGELGPFYDDKKARSFWATESKRLLREYAFIPNRIELTLLFDGVLHTLVKGEKKLPKHQIKKVHKQVKGLLALVNEEGNHEKLERLFVSEHINLILKTEDVSLKIPEKEREETLKKIYESLGLLEKITSHATQHKLEYKTSNEPLRAAIKSIAAIMELRWKEPFSQEFYKEKDKGYRPVSAASRFAYDMIGCAEKIIAMTSDKVDLLAFDEPSYKKKLASKIKTAMEVIINKRGEAQKVLGVDLWSEHLAHAGC